jgi:hypothetical protein
MKEIDLVVPLNLALILHVLRNPYGWSETAIRTVRLAAADMLEQIERMLK